MADNLFAAVAIGLIEPSREHELTLIKEASKRGYALRATFSLAYRPAKAPNDIAQRWIVWHKSIAVEQGTLAHCVRYIYEQCDINTTVDSSV